MSTAQAEAYVRARAEDEGPDSPEEAAEIFAALYGRAPDHDDETTGVWSLCCAAVQSMSDSRETGLDNGETGDAKISLVVCRACDCIFDNHDKSFVPALATNSGPMGIRSWDMEEDSLWVSFAAACESLGCDPHELRSAVELTYPAAVNWDWADAAYSATEVQT